jgi:hypothetical protein
MLIKPKLSSSEKVVVLGFRERNLYRIKGKAIRAMESSTLAENKEQVSLKVKKLRGSQPSGSGGKEKPSKSVRQESWYEMVMHDS